MSRQFNICLAVLVATSVLHANAETPSTNKFNSDGHPKAMGIKFSLTYPSTWTAREGKRPHVVQMMVSPDPTETFMIVLKELGPFTKEEKAEILSKDAVMTFLPEGAQMLTHATTKLDGESCAMCEWLITTERAGIKIEQRSLIFILPYQEHLITLTGTTGGLAGSARLPEKFIAAKARFQIIAASLFLPEKWEKK